MLTALPFLISPNSLGVIFFVIFLGSASIFIIPVFATRGMAQALWFGLVGFALTVEVAVMVTLVVLTSNGTIWS